MKLKSILSFIGIEFDTDIIINSIKTNSKEVVKNDLFIAINKGHDYIDEAIKNGAVCVILENDIKCDVLNFKVDSTKEILKDIARYLRILYNIPLIAITGSTGKTTTKDLISLVLSSKYNVLKSIKNHNNDIGLPETLLRLNNTFDMIVVEMGMNHLKEISELSKIALPNFAVITNIGSAHIGNLGSIKNILKAKLEITDGLNGSLIINNSDKYLKKVKYKNLIKVDKKKLKVKKIRYETDKITFYIDNIKFSFNIPFKHILIDVFLAIKIGLLFGIPLNTISNAIKNYKPEIGRLNIRGGKYEIIDDSYNSSYEAVIPVLKTIRKSKKYKYIILGDILELGSYSKKYHKKINKYLKKIKNKEVILIGTAVKYIKGIRFENVDDINAYLKNNLKENSLIYIKGSRKMNLDKIKI